MFPVVLVVVVLGASIAAVAVDLLYDADKPATAGDESRSSAEPWPAIWRRVHGTVGGAARSLTRAVTRGSVAMTSGLAHAVRGIGRTAVSTVRSARAADDLLLTDVLARAANLRERRSLQRVADEVRLERTHREATAAAAHQPALAAAHAASGATGRAPLVPGPAGHAGGHEIPVMAAASAAPAEPATVPGQPLTAPGYAATAAASSPGAPWWRTTVLPGPPPPRGAGPPGPLLPLRREAQPDATGARDRTATGRPAGPRRRRHDAGDGPADRPVDPRLRAGVPVPLGTPPTARFRALAALLAITTVLGIALAGAFLALALVVLRALGGL